MDSLIRNYLDGELSESEVQDFLAALAADPELNREVAALEEVVALGAEQQDVVVSPQFADRVMASIAAQSHASTVWARRPRRWGGRLAMAASWVLALGLGYFLAAPGRPIKTNLPTSVAGVMDGAKVDLPQVVRLVYATAGDDVKQVGVAGSFNNWDPSSTPMRLEDGVWVALLMLPPDSYEYMFVENNNTWVTDPLAQSTRDDGFGSRNAVLDVGI